MKHTVIYIPGLGDKASGGPQSKILRLWRFLGLKVFYQPMGWSDKQPFELKFQKILNLIDEQAATGRKVSLIGVSAGASAAINAYAARLDKIHKVVCICGKINNPQKISETYYQENPAFKDSIILLADSLNCLDRQARQKILSLRPWADEVVPPDDTIIVGAHNRKLLSVGHVISIAVALTIGSWRIARFIKS